jgi:alpha-glucosidase
MYFNKIPPAVNFKKQSTSDTKKQIQSELKALGEGVYHYRIESPRWSQESQAEIAQDIFSSDSEQVSITEHPEQGLTIRFNGHTLLQSFEDREFGLLGRKWAMSFTYKEEMRLYGLGEKNDRLEKTGGIYKFWNTDTIGDFGMTRVRSEPTDPMYVSIPYLLIKQKEGCVGILINNPFASFMNLGAKERIANLLDAKEHQQQSIHIGAYDGTPDLYFIVGPTTKSVTRKLQRLCGTTPLPPLWSLGYQQCRWGYGDLADLESLDRKFEEFEIPCDGLWMDIDYMDAYQVFTVAKDGFQNHQKRIKALQNKGRKIIPILDPGVKYCPGYPTFDDGADQGIFCQTPDNEIYSGFVWPGRTVFPDYSQEQARNWWAKQLEQFTKEYSFDGYWLDMNDPSTGSAELEDMHFNQGKKSHDTFHNQYAYGMQKASHAGLSRAIGKKRPFLLSRSGFISSSKYAAIWTGDNSSNYFHLKASISMSVNLSLSGIPFNGPDVPGFEGDTTPELAVDWFKAGFLFPFLRNHSSRSTREQEPWAFAPPYQQIITHYIRLRYKLLPYLYNLFIEHTRDGDPILRPIFYEFNDADALFDKVDDQFMVGPAILQAPIVYENTTERKLSLPTGQWLEAASGNWIQGGNQLQVKTELNSTPLYIRDGSIIAMLPGERKNQHSDLSKIECHIFISEDQKEPITWNYTFDDGETIQAVQSSVTLEFSPQADTLLIECQNSELNKEALDIQFVSYRRFKTIRFKHNEQMTLLEQSEQTQHLTGKQIQTAVTTSISINNHHV